MTETQYVAAKQLAAPHSLGVLGTLAVNIPPVPAAQAQRRRSSRRSGATLTSPPAKSPRNKTKRGDFAEQTHFAAPPGPAAVTCPQSGTRPSTRRA